MFVSYAPELDVSSCGHSAPEAQKNLQDAVAGFLEVARDKGTLEDILEEAGFSREDTARWQPRRVLATDRMQLAM